MLSKESTIILHSSKVDVTITSREIIIKNVSYDIDWGKLLYLCIHHSVTPLVYKTLKELDLLRYIDSNVMRIMVSECEKILGFNLKMYKEIYTVNRAFRQDKVKAILIKGALLADSLYGDKALRQFGDADYLIDINDAPIVTKVLKNLGFIQSDYDPHKKELIPMTRHEIITRRMNTHSIGEFMKIQDSEIYTMDINFEIFWKGHKNNKNKFTIQTNELTENSSLVSLGDSEVFSLSPEYQLIQLCAHLYSHAVYFCWLTDWYKSKNDLRLIRFCDLYELIMTYKVDWRKVKEIVSRNKIEEPIYYSLKLLNKLYGNTVPEDFLINLGINENVTEKFYDKQGNELYWETNFYDRMFNIHNRVRDIYKRDIL